MSDLIDRQAAIDAIRASTSKYTGFMEMEMYTDYDAIEAIEALPSAQLEQQHGRVFKGIVVEYPSYSPCSEYKGKPYFSIKYTENGQEFIGYGTYKPEVLSEYLKTYFIFAQPEQQWTPCSERLPEKPDTYTVTDSKGDVVRFVFNDSASSREYWLRCAKAWMPLPKPYEEDRMDELISRQAAIDALDAILPVEPMKNEYTQGITCGAALAIEYVKQLPSVQPEHLVKESGNLVNGLVNDCISRQAAIKALGERPMVWAGSDYELGARNQYDADALAIETVPSAQSERKRWKWMLADMYESTHKAMLCNKCNAAYDMTIVGGMFNYCPHCGADMRGEQDG